MTPGELSARLRAMADKIDRSSRPSVTAVTADVNRLAGELADTVYDTQLYEQQTESPIVAQSRRPSTLSVDVSRDGEYDRAMQGLLRRASRV